MTNSQPFLKPTKKNFAKNSQEVGKKPERK